MVRRWMLLSIVLAAFAGAVAVGQDGGAGGGTATQGGDNAGRGGGGRRGNFDPEQMRQRMMDNLKEQLKADDKEWPVLQPKLEKLMTAQRNARAGGFGGMGFGGGRRGGGAGGAGGDGNRGPGGPPGGGDQPQTELGKAGQSLRTALQDDKTSEKDLADKLAAFRDARKKAEAELATARTQIKDVLTPRQEAVLVMAGMLE